MCCCMSSTALESIIAWQECKIYHIGNMPYPYPFKHYTSDGFFSACVHVIKIKLDMVEWSHSVTLSIYILGLKRNIYRTSQTCSMAMWCFLLGFLESIYSITADALF